MTPAPKQIWHIECYNRHTGKQSAPRGKGKWTSLCNICRLPILRGQNITWSTAPRGTLPTGNEPLDAPEVAKPAPAKFTDTHSSTGLTPEQWNKQQLPAQPIAGAECYALIDNPAALATPRDAMDQMAKSLVPYLLDRLASTATASAPEPVDYERVKRTIADVVLAEMERAKLVEHRYTVEVHNVETDTTVDMGIQHKLFPKLLRWMSARQEHDGHRLNIWLSGPAGSGKTSAAKYAAKALGLRFGFCGALDAKYDLSGFINASGQCVNTEFRDFYINGGVFLLDELDSWNPAAQLWLNAALANGEAAFPDGTQHRHADFCCLGAANTWGLGGTSDYVGRTKLDAAFLDRFSVRLAWDYDEDLELALTSSKAFTRRVHELRAKAKSIGLKIIISPRKSITGCAGLAVGMTPDEILDDTIFAGLSAEDVRRLKS